VDCLERRAEPAQVLQHLGGDEVTGVQDEVRPAEVIDAGLGESPRASGEVGVGDDGEAHFC